MLILLVVSMNLLLGFLYKGMVVEKRVGGMSYSIGHAFWILMIILICVNVHLLREIEPFKLGILVLISLFFPILMIVYYSKER